MASLELGHLRVSAHVHRALELGIDNEIVRRDDAVAGFDFHASAVIGVPKILELIVTYEIAMNCAWANARSPAKSVGNFA